MNPLKLILTTLLLVSTALSYGQRKKKTEETFYSFDENWKDAGIEKSKYFVRRIKISDSCWQWDTYNMYGPMIKSEQYIDEKGSLAHGRFTVFNARGKLDSLCYYSKGYPNGTWYVYNDPFYNIMLTYNMGVLINTEKTVKVKGTQSKDSTKKEEDEAAEYPGGLAAWQQYLKRSLTYPQRALKAHIMGSVGVSFTIEKTGYIEESFIYRSVEFSLDEEALRIIRESRRWVAAMKDGIPAKSKARQPIIFRLPN